MLNKILSIRHGKATILRFMSLRVQHLIKNYASVTAVNDISFDVKPGEIVGLLGPNGAGKTTTINMILGVLEPSSGSIHIDNLDIATHRQEALERANFAAVYAALPGNLTVEQNLRIFGMIYNVPQLTRQIEAVLQEFNLIRFRHTKAGALSSGEQTRVCLAKAMLNKPKLLLLDEPTASLDPSTARDIRHFVKKFALDQQSAVLWTSHNMHEVQEVCDRVLFMSHGKILLEGNPRTLPQQHGKETLEDLFIAIAREPLTLTEAA